LNLDLSVISQASEDGAVMELVAGGQSVRKADGTPVTIRLAGMESAKWRKARNSIYNRSIKTLKPGQQKTAEQSIDEDAELLASVTLSWDGISDKGQDLECNFANAKKIYVEYDWLREQVTEFIRVKENFWRASPQS
jgi:hypothetical protein